MTDLTSGHPAPTWVTRRPRGGDRQVHHRYQPARPVRRHVRRGTLHVHVRVERQCQTAAPALNTAVLADYLRQIRAACHEAGAPEFVVPLAAGALNLPGVAPETRNGGTPPDDEWPVVEKTLDAGE